tara:strand:- start:539 stop:1069 length:531 start_codon:yes stop_codon:yes gene_type:complete
MKEELLSMLKEKSYKRGEYLLSSGDSSEHYVNCKPVTLSGKGLFYASCLLLEEVEDDSVAVAGLTLGADPLVSGVVTVSAVDEVDLDALIVRKEPKGHGTQAWIEGPELPRGSKVTVLEDVITTGGSACKAVRKLREVGYIVERVITIVDRGGAEQTMKDHNLELVSLYTLKDLIG